MKPAHTCGRTEIGAFELTVPALMKTMTELSVVTITQVSMETTTVDGACSATAVGLFFLSSLIQTLANSWYVAHRNCPSNDSTFIQSVELAPDTSSCGDSHGKPVARRILDN